MLAFWAGETAAQLLPLRLRLSARDHPKSWARSRSTTASVRDPGRGRTNKGFLWAIAGRRGACRSSVEMAVFTPNS